MLGKRVEDGSRILLTLKNLFSRGIPSTWATAAPAGKCNMRGAQCVNPKAYSAAPM
jgi:hypothetical protein